METLHMRSKLIDWLYDFSNESICEVWANEAKEKNKNNPRTCK